MTTEDTDMKYCSGCKGIITNDDYRWTVAYRKDDEIGSEGFEEKFCSVECFLYAAQNVRFNDLEEKLGDMIDIDFVSRDGYDAVSWSQESVLVASCFIPNPNLKKDLKEVSNEDE